MGRTKQGVFVKAFEPENCIDCRVKQLYFNALESTAVRKDDVPQVSTRNLVMPKFYLFEKSLGFYHPNLHSPILVISGKTEGDVEETFVYIQDKLEHLFHNDETVDSGVSSTPGRKPLAEYGQFETPRFVEAGHNPQMANKVRTFLKTLGSYNLALEQQFELACSIDSNYFPVRHIDQRGKKPPKKKPKKKSTE